MTAWAQSLIRISNHQVETLQKRLAEITGRRISAEVERERARQDTDANMMLSAYLDGWKLRRNLAEGDLATIEAEESGARDALGEAFEELKKFEHVAEVARLERLAAQGKRDGAALDELGLRRRSA